MSWQFVALGFIKAWGKQNESEGCSIIFGLNHHVSPNYVFTQMFQRLHSQNTINPDGFHAFLNRMESFRWPADETFLTGDFFNHAACRFVFRGSPESMTHRACRAGGHWSSTLTWIPPLKSPHLFHVQWVRRTHQKWSTRISARVTQPLGISPYIRRIKTPAQQVCVLDSHARLKRGSFGIASTLPAYCTTWI